MQRQRTQIPLQHQLLGIGTAATNNTPARKAQRKNHKSCPYFSRVQKATHTQHASCLRIAMLPATQTLQPHRQLLCVEFLQHTWPITAAGECMGAACHMSTLPNAATRTLVVPHVAHAIMHACEGYARIFAAVLSAAVLPNNVPVCYARQQALTQQASTRTSETF